MSTINQVFNSSKNSMGNPVISKDVVVNSDPIVSFDDILKDLLLPSEIKKDERRYILTEKKIDQFTVIRGRKLVTPATCLTCAFDILENFNNKNNSYLDFDSLSDEQKQGVLEALVKHIELMHPLQSQKIVTESELMSIDF